MARPQDRWPDTSTVSSPIGTLHSDEVIKKFKDAGADDYVMHTLCFGVPLHFLTLDLPKFPRHGVNNNSAIRNSAFMSETIRSWESRGYIKRIDVAQARCVLPLSAAMRFSHSKQKLKYRLVLDCSPLTDFMSYGGIKLPDLNFLRNQITKDSWIGILDLESFYLQ